MDDAIQEMLDHYQIRKTLSEYCHGCDRCDKERMGSVYLDDSWDDHGSVKAAGPEFTEIMSAQIVSGTLSMYHLLGQSTINVLGDEAGAETYILAASQVAEDDGRVTTNQLGGRFVDTLRREKGRWLIKRRVVVRDWTVAFPGQPPWESAMALTPGERSNADPAFGALGRVHSQS
jgi:SnoaL-like domain